MPLLILVDQPEDGYIERVGWVAGAPSERAARDMLTEFCVDDDGEPGHRPCGPAEVVFLRSNGGVDEDERWEDCSSSDDGACAFWKVMAA